MQVHLFSNIVTSNTILSLVQKSKTNGMKRTLMTSILAATVALLVSSCTREEKVSEGYIDNETQTIFNISVEKNTKTKTKSSTKFTKSETDSKTTYDAEKRKVYIDSNTAFGLVGVDNESKYILVDGQPVYESNGVRTANLVTSALSSGSMSVSAFYPHVSNVNYRKDGSYTVSFAPNDILKGPLASEAVDMRCDNGTEVVNLKFHHIANSIGFKVCDITEDEQLRGLMRVRKVVLHGMPTEGLFVCEGDDSYWAPDSKRHDIVFYQGNENVEYGEENARFIGRETVVDDNEACSRFYVIPEVLTDKHYVEVFFDVDPFDYDGTHYRGAVNRSQISPLSGVIPDDEFEMGLQYTFVLGMNLGTVYRLIEFTASVDDWESRFNGRVLDYDNE